MIRSSNRHQQHKVNKKIDQWMHSERGGMGVAVSILGLVCMLGVTFSYAGGFMNQKLSTEQANSEVLRDSSPIASMISGKAAQAIPTPLPAPNASPTDKQDDKGGQTGSQSNTQTGSPSDAQTGKPNNNQANTQPASPNLKQADIVNPYVKYTYDQMMEESAQLAERYPDLISLDSIGSSVEGRDLLLIKLGKGSKKIILCGTHHAREYISSSYLMKMTEEYAKAYAGSGTFGKYNVKNLLDKVTLYIVPMVNPDGVNLVNNGIKAVANPDAVAAMAMVKSTYSQWKANINGVDLNRQYPAHWKEKYDNIGKPASENYKGTGAATEPEVQAMMKLSRENNFILAASFHTKGNVIYWADRGTVSKIKGVEAMAKRLSKLTGYELMPISEKPSAYGAGYENWFRLEFLRPAFCIELTPYNNTDVPHDDKKFDSLVWDKAKYMGLFLADEALKR